MFLFLSSIIFFICETELRRKSSTEFCFKTSTFSGEFVLQNVFSCVNLSLKKKDCSGQNFFLTYLKKIIIMKQSKKTF